MVKKKRQSKRMKLKDKYKIEKKVKAHVRKKRKEAREAIRNGSALRKQKRKDPGLPNLLPFKEKFLRQLQEERAKEMKQQTLRMIRRREELTRRRSGPSAEELADSNKRAEEFAEREGELEAAKDEFALDSTETRKKRAYLKEMTSVIEKSDVVLHVLDARDPLSGRADIVEKMVLERSSSKRLVFVLNKIDLVPKRVVESWLTYLRREFPTVAFRASTQNQRNNLSRANTDCLAKGTPHKADGSGIVSLGESVCVGADTLIQLLKNYSRNKGIKTSITVGVVGYPNVGKSSVINSLKRSKATGVSPKPGFTKALQVVQIDKKIKIIDSPGVLFRDSNYDLRKSPSLILQNCVDPTKVEDPLSIFSALYERCDPEKLMLVYRLARFNSSQEFLALLSKKRGKLKAGGIPDMDLTSRIVLKDWCMGKLPFYTEPPKDLPTSEKDKAEVVSSWAKEFDMDALLALEEDQLVRHSSEFAEEDVAMLTS